MTIVAQKVSHKIPSFDQPDIWENEWFRTKLLKSLANDGFDRAVIDQIKQILSSVRNFEDFAEKAKLVPALVPVVNLLEARREYNTTIYSPKNPAEYKARFWPNNPKLLQTNWENYEDIYEASIVLNKPRFITKDTPIISAGSCFAANIALQLQDWGYNYLVEMKTNRAPKNKRDPGWKWPTDFASIGNVYNAMSMRQMIERGFGEWTPEKILLHRDPFYAEPFREVNDSTNDEEFIAKFLEHNEALKRALLKCEVFIMTIGLSEAWVFADSGLALIGVPRKKCDRTLLYAKNLTVQDNLVQLERVHELFQKYNPRAKIIATVSPVPLGATYNIDKHVVVANSLSKATIRVALEMFTNAHPKTTYYFPAYELVTVCTKDPWQISKKHVTNSGIARVMKEFQNVFLVDQTPMDTIVLPEMHEIIPTKRNYPLRFARKYCVHPLKRALGIEGKSFRQMLTRKEST